jgi:CRP/FNR family cyclic AMP-dependent transcriptional regulator
MRKALQLLGMLDDVDIEWIATHGNKRSIKLGEILIQESSPIESLWVVLEGRFSVQIAGLNQKQIATLYSGEIVGELSFVDSRPPLASVVAAEDSQVFTISRQVLADKLAKDFAFAARFYRAVASFLADRLRFTTARLGYGDPHEEAMLDRAGELDDSSMDELSLAAVRFDKLLKRMSAKEPRFSSDADREKE